jgi:hypothetical protein
MLHLVGFFFMNCTMKHGSTKVNEIFCEFYHIVQTKADVLSRLGYDCFLPNKSLFIPCCVVSEILTVSLNKPQK